MKYLSLEYVITIHEVVLKSSSWLSWIINKWQLESMLEHIKNSDYYPSVLEKLTHLFFWITQFHCFNDWNKRTAIVVTYSYLVMNQIFIEDYIVKMEDIAVWVAKWEITKEDLKKIFKSMFISFNIEF